MYYVLFFVLKTKKDNKKGVLIYKLPKATYNTPFPSQDTVETRTITDKQAQPTP